MHPPTAQRQSPLSPSGHGTALNSCPNHTTLDDYDPVCPPPNDGQSVEWTSPEAKRWLDEGPPIVAPVGWASGKKRGAPAPQVKPVPYSMRELMQLEFTEAEWVISGLLAQGVYILGGKPKIGKSWLALHILLTIVYGLRVFGTLASTKGQALYVSLEDHDRRLFKRVKQVCTSEPSNDLFFVTEWPRIGNGCVELLDEWLTAHPETKLVIFDTLARIKPARKNNDDLYATDYAAVSAFKGIAEKYGIAVILVHHLRKMVSEDPADMLSGTTGLAGGVDGTLILTKKVNSQTLTLHRSGRDLVDDEPLNLAWNRDSGEWLAVDAPVPGERPAIKKDEAKSFLLGLLGEGPQPSQSVEYAAKSAGLSWASVRRAQKELGIQPFKQPITGKWCWGLPDDDTKAPSYIPLNNMNNINEINKMGNVSKLIGEGGEGAHGLCMVGKGAHLDGKVLTSPFPDEQVASLSVSKTQGQGAHVMYGNGNEPDWEEF